MVQALDPFVAAAYRQRQGVRPEAGRQAGPATHVLENYLPHVAKGFASLPERATQAAGEFQRGGEYDPGPAMETAMMMAGRTPFAQPGSAGVFGGKLAKTADLDMLAKAQEMAKAGRDQRPIYEDTKWFQGPTNDWRFEIPDWGVKANSQALQQLEKDTFGYLGDILPHPDLYRAYPEFKNMPVRTFSDPGAAGAYDGWAVPHEILYNPGESPAAAKGTLLHEVQHAVQHREGGTAAAAGSGPNGFTELARIYTGQAHRSRLSDKELRRFQSVGDSLYHRQGSEIEARNVERRMNKLWWEQPEPWWTEDVTPDKRFNLRYEVLDRWHDKENIMRALMSQAGKLK